MTTETEHTTETRSSSVWKIIGVIFFILALALGIGIWQVFTELFPGEFEPVTLSQEEERVLEQKLARIDPTRLQAVIANRPKSEGPAPYTSESDSKAGIRREIAITERELNAMLAKYSTIAHLVAVELPGSQLNARELIPFDKDTFLIGGRTIELNLSFEVDLEENRPALFFKAGKIWGMDIPESWIGDKTNTVMENVFEVEKGFWEAFAENVENITVRERALRITLKE